jgi:hypothetical protein
LETVGNPALLRSLQQVSEIRACLDWPADNFCDAG